MIQFLGFLVLVAVAVVAIKIALVFLILGGLIFRTKETLGVVLLCGALALLGRHPIIGWLLIAVLIIIAIVNYGKEDKPSLPDVDAIPKEPNTS